MVIIFNANSPVKAFDKTKQLCTYMYNIYMCIYIYMICQESWKICQKRFYNFK